MLEVKITITAPELANAINNLARVIAKDGSLETTAEISQTIDNHVPNEPTMAPAAVIQGATSKSSVVEVPLAAVPVAPHANIVPDVNPIPTAAPQYTLDMIATAGSALIDAGMLDQLMGLLRKYGVDSVTNLKPETYGAVAMDLRALGARI